MTDDSNPLRSHFNRPDGGSLWRGYYLVRGYHKDADPYAVVTDLPFAEAVAVCEAAEPGRGLEEATPDGRRDQRAYMEARLKTENWLRQKARDNGVLIAKQNPVYFAFTREPERFKAHVAQASPESKLIILAADKVDLSSWSFTLDDHFFADLDSGAEGEKKLSHYEPHPLHGKVLNAAQLLAALDDYGYPEDEYAHNFEAQMWAPAPVMKEPVPAPQDQAGNGLHPG